MRDTEKMIRTVQRLKKRLGHLDGRIRVLRKQRADLKVQLAKAIRPLARAIRAAGRRGPSN